MKTIELKLYEFSELSEDAKQNALDRHNEDFYFYHSDEYLDTIKTACNHFGYEFSNYRIDWHNANVSYWKITGMEDIQDMRGVRLFKYLHNNEYLSYFCKYDKKIKDLLSGFCPFTGVCHDEDFLDTFRDFIKKPDNRTLKELVNEAIQDVLQCAEKDIEYQLSEEGYAEYCEANERYFDEYGTERYL